MQKHNQKITPFYKHAYLQICYIQSVLGEKKTSVNVRARISNYSTQTSLQQA